MTEIGVKLKYFFLLLNIKKTFKNLVAVFEILIFQEWFTIICNFLFKISGYNTIQWCIVTWDFKKF